MISRRVSGRFFSSRSQSWRHRGGGEGIDLIYLYRSTCLPHALPSAENTVTFRVPSTALASFFYPGNENSIYAPPPNGCSICLFLYNIHSYLAVNKRIFGFPRRIKYHIYDDTNFVGPSYSPNRRDA